MSASIATDVELDEVESTPMTDADHAQVVGWAWDDPDATASELL